VQPAAKAVKAACMIHTDDGARLSYL